MATDLTTIYDHPAVLLEALAREQASTTDGRSLYTSQNAAALRTYERQHEVTFAALDNDGLATVRRAYREIGGVNQVLAMADMVRAVGDLLGLDD